MLTGEATPLKPQLPLHKPPFEQAAYNKPVAKMHERMPEDRVQAEHMAAPVAETDAEIVLDWSKWPSTQARRSLSRSLATLMLLEESDVDRFMARNLGQRSQLTKNDLNRMRDVLNALADALDAGDERQSKALEAAWILLCPKS